MILAKRTAVAIVAMIILSGCPNTNVTYKGRLITNPALRNYAIAISSADITFANITKFLIQLDKTGVLPAGALKEFRDTVAVEFVLNLSDAQKTLENALENTLDLSTDATLASTYSRLLVLQLSLQQVVILARRYGW